MRKLMEAAEQLNEEFVEYRDPDGEFQVIYSFPRGYIAVGKNDAKQDISGESFDNLDDAIEHAEICLSIGDDNAVFGRKATSYEEMQDYMDDEDQFVDEQIDEISGDGEPDLRLKIEKMIVPQVEDDANPEEWIQLMIYAFDEIDQPFNVEVATAVLADYGMVPHCDLDKRFGSIGEAVGQQLGDKPNWANVDLEEYYRLSSEFQTAFLALNKLIITEIDRPTGHTLNANMREMLHHIEELTKTIDK